ncbi:butyrophilin subfamily 3 member A1-like [Nelusetta ayraudi]|uniref:butyrophilin subfamily 3 member A1-like n=1 Tax=Nelusetta ayraudi TaxID=303726 RepID=UPI003F6F579B
MPPSSFGLLYNPLADGCSHEDYHGSRFGAVQVACPLKKVQAISGDDVLLPCHTDPRINLSTSTLDWKRPDLLRHDPRYIVYVYRNQKDDPQSDQDADRTSVSHRVLQWGDLSLLISSVRPSDSGPYESYLLDYGCVCTIQLNVVNRTTEVPSTASPSTRAADQSRAGAANFPAVAFALMITVLIVVGAA